MKATFISSILPMKLRLLMLMALTSVMLYLGVYDSNSGFFNREDLSQAERVYANVVLNNDPSVAIALLEENGKKNATLDRNCHPILHSIGHAAFEKYGDFKEAVNYQDGYCNSGYLHGLIESFLDVSGGDFGHVVSTACAELTPGSFESWQCFHGLGHGFMFYNGNEVLESLTVCDRLTHYDDKEACYTGVFMENSVSDEGHPSAYIKTDDPMYPCYELDEQYKISCYTYAPSVYARANKPPFDYDAALNWCTTAERSYEKYCAGGVGGFVARNNVSSLENIEPLCSLAPEGLRYHCLWGAAGVLTNYSGGTDLVYEWCDTILDVEQRSRCDALGDEQALRFLR